MTSSTHQEAVAPDAVPRFEPAPALADAKQTVLCVDDEPGVLAALKRVLRSEGVAVITVPSGVQALEVMESMPVDLVISDMRMPGMDGAQLLEQIRLKWPETVRILLTGHSDAASTVAAVNRGRIFRYLQKPWDDGELVDSVREGLDLRIRLQEDARLVRMAAAQNAQLRQLNDELHQLQERDAEERRNSDAARQRRYLQSVKVLTNLMEVRSKGLFDHGRRVAALARDVARSMGMPPDEVLDVFVAGLLHDIGLIGVPDDVLSRLDGDDTSDAGHTYREHPALSARALAAMEDMLPITRLIEAHHEHFGGGGFPAGSSGGGIPLGARILAVADAADDLAHGRSGLSRCTGDELAARLASDGGRRFDPAVVDVCLPLIRARRD